MLLSFCEPHKTPEPKQEVELNAAKGNHLLDLKVEKMMGGEGKRGERKQV